MIPEKCICPDCGHEVDKKRGVPCRSMKCPECGAGLVAKIETVEVIREEGGKWVLYTADGSKKLGTFDTKTEAEEREKQIQYFKSQESLVGSVALVEQGDVQHLIRTWDEWAGSFDACVSALRGKPGISDVDALCAWMHHEAEGRWPTEEAARPHLPARLQGRRQAQAGVEVLREAANVADYLESRIHRAFTLEADDFLGSGKLTREERIALSSAIGDALSVFSTALDTCLPDLRARLLVDEDVEFLSPIMAADRSARTIRRDLSADVWDRKLTESRIDTDGNLSGIIVVEGESGNGNVYTSAALENGVAVFAGKPIYADHPTRSEERDRPERSVRDLVGALPENPDDLWVDEIAEGEFAGRKALFYRNGVLSETADWLATLIREGIAGAQSIRADGLGNWLDPQRTRFQVEAFASATSLDFVTKAAAGGRAGLQESASQENITLESTLSGVSFEQLVEARPDLVDSIAVRERRKAYGEKDQLRKLKEKVEMSKQLQSELTRLKASLAAVQRVVRTQRARDIVAEATRGLPAGTSAHVRRLVESDVRRFVEQEGDVELTTEPPGEVAPTSPDLGAGDPPQVELPPDAGALPEEAQVVFLETYVAHIAEGEEMATHKAWAAVAAAGWVKDEASGEWAKVEPEIIAAIVADELGGEPPAEPPTEMVTEESLRRLVAQAVKSEKEYLARVTGAGRITGIGGIPITESESEGDVKARRVASYRKMGLTEAEARTAVEGR